ncbi:MAG: CoA-binding protein [Bacteroidota bacterium]
MAEKDFTKNDIALFMENPWFAFVGATENKKKFGHSAFRELKYKGIKLIPVNPNYPKVDGQECYQSLLYLPERPQAVISMVPRDQCMKVVSEAYTMGVKQIWIQMDSDSPEALEFCKDHDIKAIHGECILMHAQPVKSFHGVHRWFRNVFGGMPK